MKLESDCYYQGKLSVDTYTDDFVCLVNNASYTDPITIVVKFRRGLDPAIQDKITKSGRDCPSDHDLAAWYAAAPLFDQNRMANTAFHTSTGRRPPISLHPPVARPSHSFMCSTPQSVMPTLTRSTTPIASMAVPMDIDTQRAQHATPKMCYRCGSTTHLPNCPQRFDVRHMTTDERDAYVQTVLTELDHTPEGSSDESATAVTDRGGLCSPQRAASTPPLSSAVHYACLVEDNTHNTTTCKPDQPKGVQPHPNPPRTGNFFSPGRDIVKCLRGGTGHLAQCSRPVCEVVQVTFFHLADRSRPVCEVVQVTFFHLADSSRPVCEVVQVTFFHLAEHSRPVCEVVQVIFFHLADRSRPVCEVVQVIFFHLADRSRPVCEVVQSYLYHLAETS
jgi:hypothetical protein